MIAPIAAPRPAGRGRRQGVDLAEIEQALARSRRGAVRPAGQVVAHYLDRLDPDGPEPDPTEGRRLYFDQHADGVGDRPVDLDAVGGEKVHAALEAHVQADRPAGDQRTRAQQLADALVQLADNALAAGAAADAAHASSRTWWSPSPGATWSTRTPARAPGAPASGRRSPPPGPAGWPATAAHPHRASAPTGSRWISAAPSGSSRRTSAGRVELRDQTCVFAGCARPHLLVRRPPPARMGLDGGETSAGQLRPALRTAPHQGPPRLPHRTRSRRPMAHLPPRRHRDPDLRTRRRLILRGRPQQVAQAHQQEHDEHGRADRRPQHAGERVGPPRPSARSSPRCRPPCRRPPSRSASASGCAPGTS